MVALPIFRVITRGTVGFTWGLHEASRGRGSSRHAIRKGTWRVCIIDIGLLPQVESFPHTRRKHRLSFP
jgi:hypothetical protein